MRWKIKHKLFAAVGIVMFFMLIIAGINWSMMTSSIHWVEQAQNKGYAGALLVTSLRYDVTQVWQWLTDIPGS